MSVTDLVQKAVILVHSVDALKASLARIEAGMISLHERVAKLETGGDVVAERARSAAFAASMHTSHTLVERITRLEIAVNGLPAPAVSRPELRTIVPPDPHG